MVTHTVPSYHCQSENIVKNGTAPNGKQKYRCLECKRQSRDDPAPLGYPPERRQEILNAYQERSSLRGLSRTFGVARNTVSGWLKKRPELTQAQHYPHAPTARRAHSRAGRSVVVLRQQAKSSVY